LASHLGGTLERDWSADGLLATLRIDGRHLPL
jgi:hypothetical protein